MRSKTTTVKFMMGNVPSSSPPVQVPVVVDRVIDSDLVKVQTQSFQFHHVS